MVKHCHAFRNVKKDVYELVKGPTGEDNFFILAALSDMKTVFEATVKDLKKSSKSTKNKEVVKADADEKELPAWLSENQQKPELDISRVRKHLKKIEFYLSWAQDFYEVFKELWSSFACKYVPDQIIQFTDTI